MSSAPVTARAVTHTIPETGCKGGCGGLRPRRPGIKPPAALAIPAAVVPGGGCAPGVGGSAGVGGALRGAWLLCRLPTLTLVCFFCPQPPSPLPLRGRGSPKVYFAGGSAPGTPALDRLRHLFALPLWCPAGACSRRWRLGGRWRGPAGGLPSLAPANPDFSLLFLPPSPPAPFPGGEGGDFFLYFAGGSAPAPRHQTACGTGSPCRGGTRRGACPRRWRLCGR